MTKAARAAWANESVAPPIELRNLNGPKRIRLCIPIPVLSSIQRPMLAPMNMPMRCSATTEAEPFQSLVYQFAAANPATPPLTYPIIEKMVASAPRIYPVAIAMIPRTRRAISRIILKLFLSLQNKTAPISKMNLVVDILKYIFQCQNQN